MDVKEIKAKIVKVKEEGKTAKVEDKPALIKELETLQADLAKAQSKPKAKAKAKTKSQGIADFAKEYVKVKGSGLTIQGKAARRIKGLTCALLTRKWTQDKVSPLTFEVTKKARKFTVTIDSDGKQATLVTKGQAVSFPLGKGAFRSVDYILNAYGFRYVSASQVYEQIESVV